MRYLFVICVFVCGVNMPQSHGAKEQGNAANRTLSDRVYSLESQVLALQQRAKALEKDLRDEKRASSVVIGDFVKGLNTLHFRIEQHLRDDHAKK